MTLRCGHQVAGHPDCVYPFGERAIGIWHLGDRVENGALILRLLLSAAALGFQLLAALRHGGTQ